MLSAANTELSAKSRGLGGTQSLENKCTARLGAGTKLGQEKPHGRICPQGGGFAGFALQDELFGSSGIVRTWNALRAPRFMQDLGFFLALRGWALWQK